tara:strand:+ start:1508 stop:2095 length:588 start_codon:yes stop_codon:yes gene_type:complete
MDTTLTQNKFLSLLNGPSTIIDIGGGKKQIHANYFRKHGHTVKVNDFFPNSDYKGKFIDIEFKEKFDAVWCSHCLEHQLDVNIFLKKIHDITKENGIVGITVPPLKHEIVGGHVSLWNAGLLLYNLVLAGFDCSESKIKSYDYNISVILRKRSILLPQLVFDRGDLVALRNFFPKDLQKDQWGHFDGQIQQLNWD